MTKGTEMCTEEDWITKRVREARLAQQTAVTEAVATRVTTLLKGKASEASLTAKELADTAKALIADMATPVAPDGQAEDEN